MSPSAAFVDALVASERARELTDADDLFGFLIGSWDVEAILHNPDGKTERRRGEIHASWVLEGRAIQDLFIFPCREDRASGRPSQGDRYATTLRTYDRALKAWRVRFINPAADETSAELTAYRHGQDIEMEGRLSGGSAIRWRYTALSVTSFHYTAERQASGGDSWHLYLELLGKRRAL